MVFTLNWELFFFLRWNVVKYLHSTNRYSHSSRVTPVLGYQPQELLGKSAYDFYHPEDQAHMKDSFEQGKQQLTREVNSCFRFKTQPIFSRLI